ncbi:unnamed protein product, partial [Vitrella brassicaformis CCMP3155]
PISRVDYANTQQLHLHYDTQAVVSTCVDCHNQDSFTLKFVDNNRSIFQGTPTATPTDVTVHFRGFKIATNGYVGIDLNNLTLSGEMTGEQTGWTTLYVQLNASTAANASITFERRIIPDRPYVPPPRPLAADGNIYIPMPRPPSGMPGDKAPASSFIP